MNTVTYRLDHGYIDACREPGVLFFEDLLAAPDEWDLKAMTFEPRPGQDRDDFKTMTDVLRLTVAQIKRVRYLARTRTARVKRQLTFEARQRLVIPLDEARQSISCNRASYTGSYTFIPFPGQTARELEALKKELAQAEAAAALHVRKEVDPFEVLRRQRRAEKAAEKAALLRW